MDNGTSRRNWLKAMGLGMGAMLAGGSAGGRWTTTSSAGAAEVSTSPADGILRVAHITDVHVQPERGGGRGMAKCLRHIHERGRPSLILNTGDCIMDSLRAGQARTQVQWELWQKVLKDECSLPIEHCMGNHDIWGWRKKESRTTGQEPLWGKKWAMDVLGLAKPYHSFDHGAWHFILLDSQMPFGDDGYCAKLDEEQFAWLEADLKATDPKRPVLIGSHIPIFSPAGIIRSGVEDPAMPGRLASTGAVTHLDIQRFWHLFLRHPNVKLCVSGHLHLSDRADFHGVTYLSNPAVCGDKWNGASGRRWEEAYTMLELHPDGRFNVEYVDYGWDAEKEAKPAT